MPEEPTTPDLVELMLRLFDALNAGDIDAATGFLAPDVVWEGITTFQGVAAIRGFWQDFAASYEELWFGQEEVLDLGNGVVFSVVNGRGRPVGSSGEVRLRQAVVAEWVDGLCVRATGYLDIDQARAAAERLAEERG